MSLPFPQSELFRWLEPDADPALNDAAEYKFRSIVLWVILARGLPDIATPVSCRITRQPRMMKSGESRTYTPTPCSQPRQPQFQSLHSISETCGDCRTRTLDELM